MVREVQPWEHIKVQLRIVGPHAHHGHHDMAKVLCFTWNMGDAKPVDEELQYWLPSGGGRFVLSVLCPILDVC